MYVCQSNSSTDRPWSLQTCGGLGGGGGGPLCCVHQRTHGHTKHCTEIPVYPNQTLKDGQKDFFELQMQSIGVSPRADLRNINS
jgi:hypothetical protein